LLKVGCPTLLPWYWRL